MLLDDLADLAQARSGDAALDLAHVDHIALVVRPATQRLDGALAYIDTPYGVTFRHRAVPVPCSAPSSGPGTLSALNPALMKRLFRNDCASRVVPSSITFNLDLPGTRCQLKEAAGFRARVD